MRIILCPKCGARNTVAGYCELCNASLGSLHRAVNAAFGSAAALALLWIAVGLLFDIALPMFAVGFGAVVSFVTVRLSRGCGPLYQLIATSATILGVLVAHVTLTIVLLEPDGIEMFAHLNDDDWIRVLWAMVLYDPFTDVFLAAGVLGGFYIWKQP